MKINFLNYIFYVNVVLISIHGTDSYLFNHKSIYLTPIYRKNGSKFILLATPDTLNTVSDLVALKFNKNKEEIDPEVNFFQEFGADKLDEVELLISLEDQFDLSIPDTHFRSLRTIKDISKYIDSKLQVKGLSNRPH